jgi:biotin synthase
MIKGMRKNIQSIPDELIAGGQTNRASMLGLESVKGADLWDLIAAAGRVREHFRGETVDICSIVNAKSGACSEDCSYCAQSVYHSTDAPVYPLIDVERMAEAAVSAKKNNARRFCIVTSGRGIDSREDLKNIAAGIRRVRDAGLSPCATLGTLKKDQLAFLRDSGLHRYHHNIETSRAFFPKICTTHGFDERLRVIDDAKDLGLSPCSGGILGMGETMKDRIDMAFTLRELDVDSVPLNFLMPIPGTPLENAAPIPPLEALHAIALFRLILPQKEIRICGGRGSALGGLHPFIFLAGADGFMIGNYLTQNGLNPQNDLKMISDLGLHS